jgi:hypothetical protein
MTDDVCAAIQDNRECGVTHCCILATEAITLTEAAATFGLHFTPNLYRETTRAQAETVAKFILHRDLAYGVEVMPEAMAQAFAKHFLDHFSQGDIQCYTNGDYYANPPSRAWNPATNATFDTGILIIGNSIIGCLWVEDED